ncbi:hypothetical protein ACPYPG_34045 [Streptomyces sp. FR-108]|uniref:hypothetical protein n=1 Tax=Streptomyces sp. FR-108 TaxID=3416665 RepID=UPI003CEFF857
MRWPSRCPGLTPRSDADVRIPEKAKALLAAIAAAKGLSLPAYLARLSETLLTPAERAGTARAALVQWDGYAPSVRYRGAGPGRRDR